MATDLEKLVVQMSADFKSYENAMAKASGITRKELAALKASAANSGLEASFDGATRGVARFGQAAKAAQPNVRALQAQTGNLAAQFQDIGVQLAGGQSPFLIALQQGTQISSVLGGAGAGGAVKALAGAFASLVSPVSLVTIGLVAAGGAAVQYFAGILGDGEKSAEELKKQADLIQQVAKDWGDAIPFVKAYADEVARANAASQAREAGTAVIADIWAPVKDRVAEARLEIEDLIAKLMSLGADTTAIVNLQDAFANLEDKVKDQSATAQDADDVANALNATMSGGIPLAGGLANAMSGLAGALAVVSSQAAAAKANLDAAVGSSAAFKAAEDMRASTRAALQDQKDFVSEQERLNSLTAEQLALESEVGRVRRDAEDAGTTLDNATAERLAQERIAAENARAEAAKAASAAAKSSSGGGGGGRSRAVSDAEREREAVAKLIEQLQFEQSIIGLSDVEKEKANALRRAGAAATAEQRAQIAALVEQTYAETEALKHNQEQLDAVRQLSSDVLGGIFEDLRDGASAADILSNALNRVAESFVKAGIDSLINGVFPTAGGTGGGLFGGKIIPGILHGGGIAGVDGYAHGRSVSPAVFFGARRYHTGGVAGLMPGEVPAILQKGETVLPRGANAGAVDVRVYMDRDGNWQAEVERISGGVTARGMAVVRKDVPKIMAETQRRALR